MEKTSEGPTSLGASDEKEASAPLHNIGANTPFWGYLFRGTWTKIQVVTADG
jgi:hypothetical protein